MYAHIYIYAGLEEMRGVYRDMYAKIDVYIYYLYIYTTLNKGDPTGSKDTSHMVHILGLAQRFVGPAIGPETSQTDWGINRWINYQPVSI